MPEDVIRLTRLAEIFIAGHSFLLFGSSWACEQEQAVAGQPSSERHSRPGSWKPGHAGSRVPTVVREPVPLSTGRPSGEWRM